jgi:hypothetical protein
MSLPYAADAETSLSPSELQVLKSQYETELAAGHVTTQTKFNYAWGLVKSKQRGDMSMGVGLLTGESRPTCLRNVTIGPRLTFFLFAGWCQKSTARTHHEGASASTTSRSATTRWATTTRRAASTVSLATHPPSPHFILAHIPLLHDAALLLEREPGNLQAQSLNQLIEKGVARGKFQSAAPFGLDSRTDFSTALLGGTNAEGYLGMALIGGAAAVASIAVAGLMRRGRR